MEQVNAVRDILQQFMFVNGVMAGFALSIAAQLMLSGGEKTKTKSLAIALFLIATMALLVSMFRATGETIALRMLTLSDAQAAYREALRAARNVLSGIVVPAWRLGLFAFIGGVGVVGWVHSRAIGLLGTVCALGAVIALFVRR